VNPNNSTTLGKSSPNLNALILSAINQHFSRNKTTTCFRNSESEQSEFLIAKLRRMTSSVASQKKREWTDDRLELKSAVMNYGD